MSDPKKLSKYQLALLKVAGEALLWASERFENWFEEHHKLTHFGTKENKELHKDSDKHAFINGFASAFTYITETKEKET